LKAPYSILEPGFFFPFNFVIPKIWLPKKSAQNQRYFGMEFCSVTNLRINSAKNHWFCDSSIHVTSWDALDFPRLGWQTDNLKSSKESQKDLLYIWSSIDGHKLFSIKASTIEAIIEKESWVHKTNLINKAKLFFKMQSPMMIFSLLSTIVSHKDIWSRDNIT
jgi:hypothetical protein